METPSQIICWNATTKDLQLLHVDIHHLIADLLAEERCLCEGRLEISDFKRTRDEEISNFPPGCISVNWCAPRCTGSYPGTRINHRCQLQVTADTPQVQLLGRAETKISLRAGTGSHEIKTGNQIVLGVCRILNYRAFFLECSRRDYKIAFLFLGNNPFYHARICSPCSSTYTLQRCYTL